LRKNEEKEEDFFFQRKENKNKMKNFCLENFLEIFLFSGKEGNLKKKFSLYF